MSWINVCLAPEVSIGNLACTFFFSGYFSVTVPIFCDIKFNEYPRMLECPMAHIKRSKLKYSAVKCAILFIPEDLF